MKLLFQNVGAVKCSSMCDILLMKVQVDPSRMIASYLEYMAFINLQNNYHDLNCDYLDINLPKLSPFALVNTKNTDK